MGFQLHLYIQGSVMGLEQIPIGAYLDMVDKSVKRFYPATLPEAVFCRTRRAFRIIKITGMMIHRLASNLSIFVTMKLSVFPMRILGG